MLRSCSYCSKYHKTTETCPSKTYRKKEPTKVSKFRETWTWRKKSLAIRQLDLFLCLHCKSKGIYEFKNLEVHHIIPIAKGWDQRLNDDNLITLCSYCHTLAEKGEISRDKLYQLIQKRYEVGITHEREFESR
jgi:5-methylcytosine-specific restriction enzyme A